MGKGDSECTERKKNEAIIEVKDEEEAESALQHLYTVRRS
jgi:hypothetical protein